jgi:hypothetical protein
VTSAYVLGGEFPNFIGFHNGTYRFPSHENLVIRGIQLLASEFSPGLEWDSIRKLYEEEGGFWSADCSTKISFRRCFGGRPVRKDRINFDLCKSWLHMCVNSHESCHSDEFSSTRPRTPPTRLVDVLEGRLVSQLSKADSYTALSYVWGDKPQLLLKTENEESLGKAGSLLDSNSGLPQTIKDAIQFCREIDVRYLWVDSLCIKQEDCEEKDAEISRMYEIYSQAALTLVALSATSSHCPLPGVSPNTRTWYQYREAVKGLELISCYPSLSSEVEKSVWFTRGWTFQEAAFSKRLLFFAPTQTIFLSANNVLRGQCLGVT